MRAMCALQILDATRLPIALDALYQAAWVDANGKVGKADRFGPILEKAIGKDLT